MRGYQVRLPLDVMFVASANPEDYTSRGRLITPLKDRFGSQIRTHYPLDVATELDIMASESRQFIDTHGDGPHVDVTVPDYLREVIATVSHVARRVPTSTNAAASAFDCPSPTSRRWPPTPCAAACRQGRRPRWHGSTTCRR